ncbi:hypothetical protein DEM27_33065 [Metarhizobium album]|uniref:Uncharacterized protein n=1 Tax=Metarhizobium album TaxID=2182425 RepID=A0A2U2DFH3_9HYPH|nr:hypothetical protein [Rhizobium album]PWE52049.1 hypothetical protein DEM27_33065 [Rhizobium album]
MKTIPLTIELPAGPLLDAIGTHLAREARGVRPGTTQVPTNQLGSVNRLLDACRKLSEAVTRLENALGTRDERPARTRLETASKMVRTALSQLQNP